MRPLCLAAIALPLALSGCAAAKTAKPPRVAASAGSPASAAAPSLDPAEDAEIKLLARIDALDGELDLEQRIFAPRRLPIAPTAFQLSDLPVAHVEPPLSITDKERVPMAALRKGELASELAIRNVDLYGYERTAVVSFKEPTLGQVVVGDWQLKNVNLNRSASSPGYINCGAQAYPRYQPARWTSLRRADGGKVSYSIADGWLDASACKIWVERRVTVAAVPILPGDLLYAFLDCKTEGGDKSSCALDAELTLIFPTAPIVVGGGIGGEVRGQNNSFGVASIPFRRGGGSSLFVRLDDAGLRSFRENGGAGSPAPLELHPDAFGVGVGVEVVQGVDDPEPIAIAYLAKAASPANTPAGP